jgi:ribosomal protein S13
MPDTVTGLPLSEIIGPDDLPRVEEKIHSAFASGSSVCNRALLTMGGKEYWFDATFTSIPGIGNDTMQVLLNARDITGLVKVQKAIEKEGIQQIEKNMEQFQILNDQIRNPLTVIASMASMSEWPEKEKILEQVKRIDDLVTRLDNGWIESNKVRSFLLRHFRHGAEL